MSERKLKEIRQILRKAYKDPKAYKDAYAFAKKLYKSMKGAR